MLHDDRAAPLYVIVWQDRNTEAQGYGAPSRDYASLAAAAADGNQRYPDILHEVVFFHDDLDATALVNSITADDLRMVRR